jgi:hypothetical protein
MPARAAAVADSRYSWISARRSHWPSTRNADIIYAGTRYTFLKTTDVGCSGQYQEWHHYDLIFCIDTIRAIAINLAFACGFMRRETGGNLRVQGSPQSRRTRAIMQHLHAGVASRAQLKVFGAPIRGGFLMVTTSRHLEINSIAVHPTHPETVYIGTNNYGVMVSDSGRNFAPSNGGYSGRCKYDHG